MKQELQPEEVDSFVRKDNTSHTQEDFDCESTETEKEVEKIGNISYKLDSTRIEHCVKLSGVHTVEKNKGRKMISPFFALAQKICLSPKGDFLLKGIYKKCNMSSAVRPVSEK